MGKTSKRQLRTNRPTSRGKYRDDWLVPLSAKHLAAAIARDGRSLSVIAQRVAERDGIPCNKQRLDHLAHRGHRCRRKLRRALARVLRVNEEYLAEGKPGHVPASILNRFFLSDSPGATPPPRAVLAASQFADALKVALLRKNLLPDVDDALYELINPLIWRVRLLKPDAREVWEWDTSGDEFDDLVVAFARCWEAILRPWLDGRAKLDVQQVLALKKATDRKDTAFHE